jgi:cell division septum initiation protein DivIVA
MSDNITIQKENEDLREEVERLKKELNILKFNSIKKYLKL